MTLVPVKVGGRNLKRKMLYCIGQAARLLTLKKLKAAEVVSLQQDRSTFKLLSLSLSLSLNFSMLNRFEVKPRQFPEPAPHCLILPRTLASIEWPCDTVRAAWPWKRQAASWASGTRQSTKTSLQSGFGMPQWAFWRSCALHLQWFLSLGTLGLDFLPIFLLYLCRANGRWETKLMGKTTCHWNSVCQLAQDTLPLQFGDALDALKPKVEQFCTDAAGDVSSLR